MIVMFLARSQNYSDINMNKVYFNKKHDFSHIKNEVEKDGSTILDETNYHGAKIKMNMICTKNNHSFKMMWNKYQQGQRCPICEGSQKKTIEFVKNYFSKFYWKCISNEYNGVDDLLDVFCPKRHELKITLHHFQSGTRCKYCHYENNTGKNHSRWKEDRTRIGRAMKLVFDLRKYKILLDDPNYNIFLEYRKKIKNKEIQKNIYEVDHIFPRIAFIDNDLDNIYEYKLIKKICNLRENLRIIPKKDNKSKSFKYNQQDFLDWFNLKLKE